MKKLFFLASLCTVINVAQAQSKVFKEISEDVRSQMKVITQDDKLVGYVLFTQLEKANEDSFNYKILLMDENLNDIGTVNFREERLDLQAASFEQDILCLAYLKSNFIGREFKNKKEYNAFTPQHSVFTQLLTLDGKITKTNDTKISLKLDNSYALYFLNHKKKYTYSGDLNHQIQLKNISQKGFVCFYGDNDGCNLIAYDLTGKELWKKSIAEKQAYIMLASGSDIYLLEKNKEEFIEGGYSLLSYNFVDGKEYDKVPMHDKDGNSLKVLNFGNDPISGKVYLSGNIIDQEKGYSFASGSGLSHGAYAGVFTMDINGHTKNDIKKTFTYWNDGSKLPQISKKGYNYNTKSYVQMSSSFRDFKGNTYFIGSEVIKRPKLVAIGISALFIPLIVVAPAGIIYPGAIIGLTGTSKCKITDAALMKLDSKGTLSYENSIDCQHSHYMKSKFYLSNVSGGRNYYAIENADTKNNYILVDDSKNIMIYSTNLKKVVRTVPHNSGKNIMNVYPAKEGHMMVVEYNKKEKYTRLSIEALN